MRVTMSLLRLRPFFLCSLRYTTGTPGKTTSQPPPTQPPAKAPPPKPTSVSTEPVEDPTKYNVPEYYQHKEFSFYDLDMQLAKYRLPQPSKYDPLKPKK
jgi:hypothetical protein